jgi:hypothetical protein
MNTEKSGTIKMDTGQRFFSLGFHAHFFPSLVWSRLRNRLRPRERQGTSFVPMEYYIGFVFCLVFTAIEIPRAISHQSIISWIGAGTGLAGILAIIIASICSRTGPPSYNGFLTGIFFFLLALGLTAGVFAGTLEHSLRLGLLGSAAGLALGYVLGILAGLGLQYLGWLAAWLDLLAGVAIIGLIVVDLVLLLG